jgi:undecaprenyl-diphosphatase
MINEILLGVIQGITEWLPISSSGHLVIFQQLFNTNSPIIFDVMLHVATLFVILFVFFEEIKNIISSFLKFDFNSTYGKLGIMIIVGSIPTAIIGLTFHDFFISLYSNLTAVSIALIINGFILFFTKYTKGSKKIKIFDAVLIGIAQGLAIIPGISRSGITISTGLYKGLNRKSVAAFSFLLSVPAILGATILEGKDLLVENINYFSLGISMLVSIIIGYIALKLLLKLVLNKKLYLFSYYCWFIGIILLLYTTI